MKEMLFIMVAILIPPSLTYMGLVGGERTHIERSWQTSQVETVSEDQRMRRPGDERARWYESSL
jgi:hypothetical protein